MGIKKSAALENCEYIVMEIKKLNQLAKSDKDFRQGVQKLLKLTNIGKKS